MRRGAGIVWLVVGSVLLLLLPSLAAAHRSGCHRWHSCPSDRDTYVCGDLGYCSQCPDNEYCRGGQPRLSRGVPPERFHSPEPPAVPPPEVSEAHVRSATGCPAEGDGGDTALNRVKNRTGEPSTSQEMTVEQFLTTFTPNLHTPKRRQRFSYAHRRYVDDREHQGIALVGYILGAKQSGPESANCHDRTRRDFHVWIGATKPGSPEDAKALRAQAVVVEPTPAGQEAHQNWHLRILQRLATQGARVRISGWLMYDPEHPEQLGKTRGTLWEVHPVTKIEVFSGDEWRELP